MQCWLLAVNRLPFQECVEFGFESLAILGSASRSVEITRKIRSYMNLLSLKAQSNLDLDMTHLYTFFQVCLRIVCLVVNQRSS